MTIYGFVTRWLPIVGVGELKILAISLGANLLIRSSQFQSPFIEAMTCECKADHATLMPHQRPSISCAWFYQIARSRLLGFREWSLILGWDFFWKVAWDSLPTHALCKDRDMELLASCPICGLDDESTKHALLWCLRARLIWRIVGCCILRESRSPWLGTFLRQFVGSQLKQWQDGIYYLFDLAFQE